VIPKTLATRKKPKLSELAKQLEELEEERKKLSGPIKVSRFCGELLISYINLARHLTRIRDLRHPSYVERITSNLSSGTLSVRAGRRS
jgi:hypothetical protein